jgi:hypothetical protein
MKKGCVHELHEGTRIKAKARFHFLHSFPFVDTSAAF